MTNTAQNEFHKLIDKRERWVSVTQENDFDVEGILAGLYDDPSHFIFELLQNAEDESANTISFYLFNDRLEIHHDGEDFDFKDVEAITGIGKSTKKDKLNKIGQFGVGFKSVFAITENPEIYSGEYAFRIKNFVLPEKLNNSLKSRTKIVLPFDHRIRGTKEVFNLVADRLKNIGETTLLFLENIQEINWFINNNEESGKYSRECKEKIFVHIRRIELQSQVGNNNIVLNQWLIFDKPVEKPACQDISSEITQNFKRKVEVAFRIKVDSKTSKELIIPVLNPKLVVFFPTGKETHLKFLIQGPYRTTPARDYIPEKDSWNIMLRNETASLVADSLTKIKELGLLTTDFLEVLPINKENFPEDHIFRPIYEAVLNKLKSDEKLLPANDGSYISAKQAFLARGKELIDLLGAEQLSLLFGKHDCQWLDSNITQDRTPELRKYLIGKETIDVEEIGSKELVSKFHDSFFQKQDDEWMIKFYTFLLKLEDLWKKPSSVLKGKKFIRLEAGTHVTPFHENGDPNAYLPSDLPPNSKTIKQKIANDENAKKFLRELGLTEPDELCDVLENIFPKYSELEISVSKEKNILDIKKICKLLTDYRSKDLNDSIAKIKTLLRKICLEDAFDSINRHNEPGKYINLLMQIILERIPFLSSFNNVTKELKYKKPTEIYLSKTYNDNNDSLESFFEGNPDIWFLDACYSNVPEIKTVIQKFNISDKPKITKEEFEKEGKYKNYNKEGFKEDYKLDGLQFFFEKVRRRIETSLYLWKLLIYAQKSTDYKIEKEGKLIVSRTKSFTLKSTNEIQKITTIFNLLMQNEWIPDKQGNFHKPSKILFTDLPDGFDKESIEAKILAEKLGFKKDIEQEFLSQLPEEKRKRYQLADTLTEEELELIEEKRKQEKASEERDVEESFNYADELKQSFYRPQLKTPEEDHVSPDIIPDPNRRREQIQAEIQESIGNELPISQRFKRVPAKKWEQKDNSVKKFLKEQYGGKCQICDYVFYKRNGEPYFEGSYLVSRTKAAWIDQPGNVLCLCANCCAKFEHGHVEEDKILEQIYNFKCSNEGETGNAIIKLKLCGEEVELKFSERHILYLQEILKASIKKTITK